MAELKDIEIFGEGTWNGNSISSGVLEDIVSAFNATKDFVKPVLKLGHNDDQTLLKKDGLPAAGWVSNVYIRGKKLFADFVDIPEKIYELIKKKAYRKVSVEIFSGYSFDGKTYPNLLGAVALLGADMPAVMTLSDILDRYNIEAKNFTNESNSNNIDVKIYTKDLEGSSNMVDKEEESKDLKLVEDLEKKIAIFQSQFDQVRKENDELGKKFDSYKSDSEQKIQTLEAQKLEGETDRFTLNLQSKNLASPSMLPLIKAVLIDSHKSEYSIGDKKLTSRELIENLLSLAKEVYSINKQETSQDLEPEEKNKVSAIEAKIEEYMATNKVNYSTAYRAVMKNAA